MNKTISNIVFGIIVIISLILSSCSGKKLPLPKGSEGPGVPLYPDSASISISNKDKEAFIGNILDYKENLLFENTTDIRMTEDIAKLVREELDSLLPKGKWRLDIDWQITNKNGNEISYSQWKSGDISLRIIIIDNLNSTIINELSRKYGFSGLKTGNTIIVTHVIDNSKPLPDMTATSETKKRFSTSTAEKLNQQTTGTAHVLTSTFEAEIHQATATEYAAIQQVTATAVSQATRAYIESEAQKFNLLSIENDFESSNLPTNWTIIREDPNRWDLTSRPGWLRIETAKDKGGDYINVFSQDLSDVNISVIVKVDINHVSPMFGNDKFITFQMICSSDQVEEITDIRLKTFNEDDFIKMRRWDCKDNNCSWANDLGSDNVSEEMLPLYIKMTRIGKKISGYYSVNVDEWSYLGENEINEDNKLERIQIYAGLSYGTPVNAYVDFVHYELLDDQGNVIIPKQAEIQIKSESAISSSDEENNISDNATPVLTENVIQNFPTEVSCGNAKTSKINAYIQRYSGKHYVFVTPGGLANWMREKASSGSIEIDKIEPGEMVFVEQGPYCSEGKFWWYVQHRNPYNGRLYRGWTAEGDDKDYWLEPCVDESGNISKYCDIAE